MVLAYVEGRMIVMTAGAAVTEGQLVELTGAETVGPASAGSTKVIGVALKDAAQNEKVTVVTEGVVEVTAAGAITAGSKVQAAANGQVSAWSATAAGDSAKIVGLAITASSQAGDTIKIKLEV